MNKTIIAIAATLLVGSFAHADPYSQGSSLPAAPIKVDKNTDKLPAANAAWKHYLTDHSGAAHYVDKNSKKLVDKNRQIYSIDIKSNVHSNKIQYERKLIGCGQKNYISNMSGHVYKTFDKRGSLTGYSSTDLSSDLKNIAVFNDSNKYFVALKNAACV